MKKAPAEPLTIGVEDFAAMLGISERQFYRQRNRGTILPPLPLAGTHSRWLRTEVVRWLEAGAPPPEEWRRLKEEARLANDRP